MRQITLFILFFSIALHSFAQYPYDKDFNQAMVSVQQGNCSAAITSFNKVFYYWSAHEEALFQAGVCYLNMNNLPDARKYLTNAYLTENGSFDRPLFLAIMELAQYNNLNSAKEYVSQSAALMSSNEELQQATGILKNYGTALSKQANFDQLESFIKTEFAKFGSGVKNKQMSDVFNAGNAALEKGNVTLAKSKFDQVIQLFLEQSPRMDENLIQTCHTMGQFMMNHQNPAEAKYFFEKGIDFYQKKNTKNAYQLSKLVNDLGAAYYRTAEYEKTVLLVNKWENEIKKQPFKLAEAKLIEGKLSALVGLKSNDFEAASNQIIKDEAERLLRLNPYLEKGKEKQYNAIAWNFLCIYYFKTDNAFKAKEYADKAIANAKEVKDETLAKSIQGNLDLINYRLGNKSSVEKGFRDRANEYIQKGEYVGAATELNNLAAIYYVEKKYDKAAPIFKESVDLSEKVRENQIPMESRIKFMETQSSAYYGLIVCLAELGKTEELFMAMENSRGRVIAEQFGMEKTLDAITLANAQKLPKSDEALVMYGSTGQGKVAICVITNTSVKAFNVDKEQQFAGIHKKYERYFQAQKANGFNPFRSSDNAAFSDVTNLLREVMQDSKGSTELVTHRDEILNAYYELLIQPILTTVAGKKTLVVCPDGYLSFIPFEALKSKSGKYVIEEFGVRYTPSVKVMKLVNERVMPANRKNVLAFGGATYAPYEMPATPIKEDIEYFKLKEQIEKNFKNNFSQRTNYSKLGIVGKSWVYLKGTLNEVAKIQTTVKGVDAFFADDFTENKIKTMSADGKLASYRAVHLATHGIAIPSAPQMSAVITTLYNKEAGGEDGYLTAFEVSNLKLKADFVALSACETGLGKVYAGEGVSGFTHSFLVSGTNGISVSQWAISDYATMLFMSGLYDLVFNKNMTFFDAMVEMKRKFVKGEYGPNNTHPNFWAPFAYYGK